MKKLLSIPAVVREVKTVDPDTAINVSMVNALIDEQLVSTVQTRTQKRLNFVRFRTELSALLGLTDDSFPRIRTIPDAWRFQNEAGIGFSESFIRDSIHDGVIRSITIGNRDYIALECFEDPFVDHFSDPTLRPIPQRVIVPQTDFPAVLPVMPGFKRAR